VEPAAREENHNYLLLESLEFIIFKLYSREFTQVSDTKREDNQAELIAPELLSDLDKCRKRKFQEFIPFSNHTYICDLSRLSLFLFPLTLEVWVLVENVLS